jgi:hypothetical protein
MVDLCLHFVFLSHEDMLQAITTRAHQWSPSFRHNASGNALFHPFHNRRRSLEHYTRFGCSRRVRPSQTPPQSLSSTDQRSINPYWKLALVFKALTDVIILDDFKTCLEKLRSNLVENQDMMMLKPPPVPPKDFQVKKKDPATVTCTTAKSSPTLVAGESPKVSLRRTKTQDSVGGQFQRSKSVRKTFSRIGTHLSPLPNTSQLHDDAISPSEKSPRSGGPHMIHVKMDLGLNKLVNSVVGRRPPSAQMESPLDPTWPRSGGVRRGVSGLSYGALSNGASSSITRSSESSAPTIPERTPRWSDDMPPIPRPI